MLCRTLLGTYGSGQLNARSGRLGCECSEAQQAAGSSPTVLKGCPSGGTSWSNWEQAPGHLQILALQSVYRVSKDGSGTLSRCLCKR